MERSLNDNHLISLTVTKLKGFKTKQKRGIKLLRRILLINVLRRAKQHDKRQGSAKKSCQKPIPQLTDCKPAKKQPKQQQGDMYWVPNTEIGSELLEPVWFHDEPFDLPSSALTPVEVCPSSYFSEDPGSGYTLLDLDNYDPTSFQSSYPNQENVYTSDWLWQQTPCQEFQAPDIWYEDAIRTDTKSGNTFNGHLSGDQGQSTIADWITDIASL
ncbi:Hypothetical predicted protein [Pelobates cultripes]|uniref:Uncharacterized protein n=1 Tax=Pelobates cultripes TaxID=61616 RepID=A0AAD1R026_PELCU|nr:Hypothetical predicted protein [Pelobates cultripes]